MILMVVLFDKKEYMSIVMKYHWSFLLLKIPFLKIVIKLRYDALFI